MLEKTWSMLGTLLRPVLKNMRPVSQKQGTALRAGGPRSVAAALEGGDARLFPARPDATERVPPVPDRGKTLRGLPQRAQSTQRIAKILQFDETCLQYGLMRGPFGSEGEFRLFPCFGKTIIGISMSSASAARISVER